MVVIKAFMVLKEPVIVSCNGPASPPSAISTENKCFEVQNFTFGCAKAIPTNGN